jgi:hypothetical protein
MARPTSPPKNTDRPTPNGPTSEDQQLVVDTNASWRALLFDDYAAIEQLVDAAPPLTDEQRIRLRRLLVRSELVD